MKRDADTTPRVISEDVGVHGHFRLLLRVLIVTLEKTCPDCAAEHEPPFATHVFYLVDGKERLLTSVALICNGCNEWTMNL